MPDPQNSNVDVTQDKDFMQNLVSAPTDPHNRAYVDSIDPDFHSASKDDQDAYIQHLTQLAQSQYGKQPTAPVKQGIVNPAAPDPFGMAAQMNPENIAEANSILKTVAPYVGAGLAASGIGEAIPLLSKAPLAAQVLTRSLAAAGGGGLTQIITNIASHRPLMEGVLSQSENQGTIEGVGGTLSGSLKSISELLKDRNAIPPELYDYLKSIGVNRITAGERTGSSLLKIVENVLGSSIAGTGPAERLAAERNPAIIDKARSLVNDIKVDQNPAAMTVNNNSLQSNIPTSLINMAGRIDSDTPMAEQLRVQKLNSILSGTDNAERSPMELGNVIIGELKGMNTASNALESRTYEGLKQDIASQGIRVPGDATSDTVQKYRSEESNAQRVLDSVGLKINEPPRILMTVKDMAAKSDEAASGIFGEGTKYTDLNDTQRALVDRYMNESGSGEQNTFDSFWNARKKIGTMIGSKTDAGIVDNRQLGMLKDIYSSMSKDLLDSLPEQLKSQFQFAMNMTKEQKDMFGNEFINSALRDDPMAGEKFFNRLMQTGNETDIGRVLRIGASNPRIMDAMQEGASNYLQNNFKSPQDALDMLKERPIFKQVMAPEDYEGLRTNLANQVVKESNPQQIAYNNWKSSLSKGGDSSTIINNIMTSPTYAGNVARMVGDNPAITNGLSTDLMKTLFNNSTTGGSYGLPGTKLDYSKLITNISNNSEALSKFIPKSSLDNLLNYSQQSLTKETVQDIMQKATVGGDISDPKASIDIHKIATLWSKERPELAGVLPQANIESIDKFTDAMRHLSPLGTASVAGKLSTMEAVRAAMQVIGPGAAVGTGAYLLGKGKGISLTSGGIASLTALVGTNGLMRFLVSPMGSRLLSEGISPSVDATTWGLRAASFLGSMTDNSNNNNNNNNNQPSNTINPVIPSSSNTQPLRPGQ